MNIFVFTASGHVVSRPDTTWERRNSDYYAPGDITRIDWSPVLTIFVDKSGKSVREQFADRYYSRAGHGILLYPSTGETYGEALAESCCLDHTSVFPLPQESRDSLSVQERILARRAITEISARALVRTGDIIVAETGGKELLCKRECGTFHVDLEGMEFDVLF